MNILENQYEMANGVDNHVEGSKQDPNNIKHKKQKTCITMIQNQTFLVDNQVLSYRLENRMFLHTLTMLLYKTIFLHVDYAKEYSRSIDERKPMLVIEYLLWNKMYPVIFNSLCFIKNSNSSLFFVFLFKIPVIVIKKYQVHTSTFG